MVRSRSTMHCQCVLLLVAWMACASGGGLPPTRPRDSKACRGIWVGRSAGRGLKSAEAILEEEGRLLPVRFDAETPELVSPSGPSVPQLVRRALYLVYIFLPVLLTTFLAMLSSSFREPYWYRMITCGISKAGAAFIKYGQWASTRPDIFPEGLCNALAMLHSSAPTHSFEYSKATIEEMLGCVAEEVFDSIDQVPLASGSIAQVHAAVMGGKKVAIKVRHPGVAEQIDMDFRVMRALADVADRTPGLKFLNLGHSMEMFSHTLASQTRLDVEGAHLLLLNRNFRHWKTVGFPEPIFMSEAVLVESFEQGVVISDYIERYSSWRQDDDCELCGEWTGGYAQLAQFVRDHVKGAIDASLSAVKDLAQLTQRIKQKVRGSGRRKRDPLSHEVTHFIVATGADLYLKMLLVDGLMHADLHPGNIMLDVDAHGTPRLTLVDAGMVAQLTDQEKHHFIGLLESLGAGDGRRAAGHVLCFSKTQTCTGQAAESFANYMEELFKVVCRGYGTGVDVGDVLRAVLKLVRTYQVRVDVNYATLLINLLCIEGIAGSLEPSYNVLDQARPLLQPHSNRFLRPLFRRVFPILLSAKRNRDSLQFKIARSAAQKQAAQRAEVERHAAAAAPV